MDIIERLKKIKLALNITTSELAKELNIPQRTLSSYESGERKISAELLEALLYRYNINPKWLLIGEGEPILKDENVTINLNIISRVVENLEQFLNDFDYHLEPSKKAYLVCIICKMIVEKKIEDLDEDTLKNFVQLAI